MAREQGALAVSHLLDVRYLGKHNRHRLKQHFRDHLINIHILVKLAGKFGVFDDLDFMLSCHALNADG